MDDTEYASSDSDDDQVNPFSSDMIQCLFDLEEALRLVREQSMRLGVPICDKPCTLISFAKYFGIPRSVVLGTD